MTRPPIRLILITLAGIAVACARPASDAAEEGRPAIAPRTAARSTEAHRAEHAADSAARSAPAHDAASATDSTVGSEAASAETTPDESSLRADPAYGAVASVPPVVIDSGPCPGEGCYKGLQWGVRARAVLFALPDVKSAVVATLEPKTEATAVGWMHQTVPQPFIVKRAASVYGQQGERMVQVEHVPGDTLWVLAYEGEGHFRVRLPTSAVVSAHNLEFSPGGGSYGKRCENHPACWGVLAAELKTTYWMKLRAPDGREGWTRALSAFVIPD